MQSRFIWMEFLESVISHDSLKTLSAIHLYKIKRQLISNTRSIYNKWLSPRQYLLSIEHFKKHEIIWTLMEKTFEASKILYFSN